MAEKAAKFYGEPAACGGVGAGEHLARHPAEHREAGTHVRCDVCGLLDVVVKSYRKCIAITTELRTSYGFSCIYVPYICQ